MAVTLLLRAAANSVDSAGVLVNSAGQAVNSAGDIVASGGKLILPEDEFGFILEWLKSPWQVFGGWLAAINAITFVMFGVDKGLSVLAGDNEDARRISDKTLFFLVFLGGGLGALFAMQTFQHKSEDKAFSIGVPLIIVLEIAAAILLFYLVTGRMNRQPMFPVV